VGIVVLEDVPERDIVVLEDVFEVDDEVLGEVVFVVLLDVDFVGLEIV
jgi:hypothetical protein